MVGGKRFGESELEEDIGGATVNSQFSRGGASFLGSEPRCMSSFDKSWVR